MARPASGDSPMMRLPFTHAPAASGRRHRYAVSLLAGGALLLGGTVPAQAEAAGTTEVADAAGAASYAYDPLGRLAGMVAADGEVARWTHDATGNITAVTRPGSPPVAVLSAVPMRVRPGQSMTLY